MQKKHEEDRSFKCGQCDQRFETNTSLASHIGEAHNSVEMLKCRLCGEEFDNKTYIDQVCRQKHFSKDNGCCRAPSYSSAFFAVPICGISY